jgi:hypothetical protein
VSQSCCRPPSTDPREAVRTKSASAGADPPRAESADRREALRSASAAELEAAGEVKRGRVLLSRRDKQAPRTNRAAAGEPGSDEVRAPRLTPAPGPNPCTARTPKTSPAKFRAPRPSPQTRAGALPSRAQAPTQLLDGHFGSRSRSRSPPPTPDPNPLPLTRLVWCSCRLPPLKAAENFAPTQARELILRSSLVALSPQGPPQGLSPSKAPGRTPSLQGLEFFFR